MFAKDRRLYILAGLLLVGILFLLLFSSHLAQQRIEEDKQFTILRANGSHVSDTDSSPRDGIFLQAIIDVLNHPQSAEDTYHSFSPKQRNEVGFEVFVEYLDLLRTYQTGQIQGLTPLPQRAVESYEERLLTQSLPENGAIAKYYYLDELTVPENERLTIRILSKDGEAMLDGQFMQSTLDLYQHAELYFSALSETNLEALTQLVYSDIDEPDLKRRKAQETLAFYQEFGFDASLQPNALEISSDNLHFRLTSTYYLNDRERVSGESSNRAEHDLVFRRTEEGIVVQDLITMPELMELKYIKAREPLDTNQQRFELDELDSSDLAGQILLTPDLKTFGLDYDPIELQAQRSVEDPEMYYIRSLDQDKLRIVFSYPSAQARTEDRQGKLIFLSLKEESETWSFESNVEISMSREDLLGLYPFFDVYDYRAGLGSDLGVRMVFGTQQQLQRIEFVAPEWLSLSNRLDQVKSTAFFR